VRAQHFLVTFRNVQAQPGKGDQSYVSAGVVLLIMVCDAPETLAPPGSSGCYQTWQFIIDLERGEGRERERVEGKADIYWSVRNGRSDSSRPSHCTDTVRDYLDIQYSSGESLIEAGFFL
jgi:hypothetical protein